MIVLNKEVNKINFYHKGDIEVVQGKSIHSFPKHSHKAFCIGIVLHGKMKLNLKNQEYLLEKNNVYFIPPYIEHKIAAINKSEYRYIVICIQNNFIKKYISGNLRNYIYIGEELGEKIKGIYKEFNSAKDYKKLESNIEQILMENTELMTNSIRKINHEAVISAVNFIHQHIYEPFKIEKISDYTHISKYHLLRLFKSQMGVAPYQFYLQQKVKKIKQELLKEQPTACLAYNLNFSDQSHLCNIFKRHVGITPMQFKKSYKKDENLE